jgi:methanethiol oxidase
MTVRPDPTFHATAKLAMQAPPEKFACAAILGHGLWSPTVEWRLRAIQSE